VHRDGGTSPVTVALAFLAGAVAGAGVVALVQWSRRRPGGDGPDGEEDDAGDEEGAATAE
jgi:hypothetical protein